MEKAIVFYLQDENILIVNLLCGIKFIDDIDDDEYDIKFCWDKRTKYPMQNY